MSAIQDRVQWLAEIACPRCAERLTVPVIVSGVRLVPPLHRQRLVADFQPADVPHRCPDPTRDAVGAAR